MVFFLVTDKLVMKAPPIEVKTKKDKHAQNIAGTFHNVGFLIGIIQVPESKLRQGQGIGLFVTLKPVAIVIEIQR